MSPTLFSNVIQRTKPFLPALCNAVISTCIVLHLARIQHHCSYKPITPSETFVTIFSMRHAKTIIREINRLVLDFCAEKKRIVLFFHPEYRRHVDQLLFYNQYHRSIKDTIL